jgi:uncharacterized protein with ParB-like and HNH nuclease domain
MPAIEKIEVHLDGIGHVLADRMLAVPVHQRTYAWTSEQVDDGSSPCLRPEVELDNK